MRKRKRNLPSFLLGIDCRKESRIQIVCNGIKFSVESYNNVYNECLLNMKDKYYILLFKCFEGLFYNNEVTDISVLSCIPNKFNYCKCHIIISMLAHLYFHKSLLFVHILRQWTILYKVQQYKLIQIMLRKFFMSQYFYRNINAYLFPNILNFH